MKSLGIALVLAGITTVICQLLGSLFDAPNDALIAAAFIAFWIGRTWR